MKLLNPTTILAALLGLFLCLLPLNILADDETRNFRAYGPALQVPGASIQSLDDKYTSSGTWASGFSILSNKVIVELGFDADKHLGHTYFRTKATFDITLTSATQVVTILTGQQLEINYDPAERTRYQDKAQLLFSGYYKIKVSNVSFQTFDAANSPINNFSLDDTYMEVEVSTNKAYPFTQGGSGLVSGQYNNAISSSDNELKVDWDFVKGSNEYELEYTYVDDYDFNPSSFASSPKSAANLNYNFRNDATRIITPFNFFKIPLNYERGYIIWRVRPIAVDISGNRIEGAWNGVPETGTIQNLLSSFPLSVYALSTAFASNINWISTKTFAEDGKSGIGMSYMDASGLERQKIARLNTDAKSIVQSTLFDHYGRPKYNILPAPVSGLDFTYRQNLNMIFNGSSISIFDKKVFDLCSSNNPCSNANFVLDAGSSAGAARYYSTVNGNKNAQQGFIPDAQGMPYVEVKYTPDLTGRILKQSLPGSAHHTGASTGKAIQYFYSHPSQIELDRLFGKEAGPASKYTKNFVIDPNGQTSTTYIDMQGRTVASALVGDPPAGMDVAADNTGLVALVDDMAAPTINIADNTNRCLEVNTSFFVPATNTQETFVYSTTLGKFFPGLCGATGAPLLCLDCAYDIEISIKDACGNEIFYDDDNNPTTNPNPVYITVGATPNGSTNKYENNCIAGEYSGTLPASITKAASYQVSATPITIIFPRIGTYTIHKKICVSDKPIQDYIALFEAQDKLCSTRYCNIVDSIIGSINFAGSCASSQLSCQACLESLATYTSNPANPPLSPSQLNILVGNCKLKCPLNTCGKKEKMLAGDFTPGTGAFAATDPADPNWGYSIFNPSNALQVSSGFGSTWNNPPHLTPSFHPYKDNSNNDATVSINGTTYYPETLTMSQFTVNFQDSWAYAFLPIHPEYCKMKFYCDVAGTSVDYDDNMQKCKHYSEACNNGSLRPYTWGYAYGPSSSCPAITDPIFSVTDPLFASLISNFTNEITTNYQGTGKSIYQAASENVYGGSIPGGHTFGSDPCSKDLEWKEFMELYLTLKDKLYNDMLTLYVQNFQPAGKGECGNPVLTNYTSKFPPSPGLSSNYGINPAWTAPANTSQINSAISSNLQSQCSSQCSSYLPQWDSDLSTYCQYYGNLTQIQKNDILGAFEAICNLGCDANHSFGSSTTPAATIFYTLPGTSVKVYNFQDVLTYYLNLYQGNNCSSYLVSEPAPYASSGSTGATSNILNDCKCDQLLKVNYDLANNINVPFGITEAWQLFKARYGFDMAEYNGALCECQEAIHQQGLASTPTITNLTWSNGFIWNGTSMTYLANHPLDVDMRLACDQCVNCSVVSTKMDAIYISLPYPSSGPNVYLAVKNSAANAIYLTNYLNINNNWDYTTQDYLDLYAACSDYTANGNYSSFLTTQAFDLANYLDDLAANSLLNQSHAMQMCTDSKYFLSSIYSDGLPVPSGNVYSYNVTPLAGNGLQIVFKLGATPKCTLNLALPLPTTWANIQSITGIAADFPAPVSGGAQYAFKLYALDQNYSPVTITGTSCYTITNLSNSAPFMPVSCPYKPVPDQHCQIGLYQSAIEAAKNIYDIYKDSNTAQFIQDYKDVCFSTLSETFTRQYNLQEFHYTLYYYDEAGNLQRTVAPKGVTPLNITTNTPPTTLYPAHSSVNCVDLNYVNQTNFNTLNQPLSEKTVDGGFSAYYYEKTGRLVASQNAKQAARSLANGTFIYSYTLYDKLSRVIETGELESTNPLTQTIIDQPYTFPSSGTTFLDFCNLATRREVVNMVYDAQSLTPAVLAKFSAGAQKNLRNRVSYTTYKDLFTSNYIHATYYSYDEHGNVTEVVQHNKSLETKFGTTAALKKMVYEYELVSGNMNKVTYQPNEADQFMHKYYYDSDNRLQEVYTSKDNTNWDRDAKYFYYEHGPLARIERADEQVQGMDYFFTIHGWIKGINSNALGVNNDVGKDGTSGNAYNSAYPDLHNWFGKDAMAYGLNYYQMGTLKDYEAINRGSYTGSGPLQNPLSNYANIVAGGPFNLNANGSDLFNGNISSMVTTFIDKDPLSNDHTDNTPYPQLTAYRYDQLQRITQQTSFRDLANNTWQASSGSNYDASYLMQLSYDKNGNIKTLKRNGAGSLVKSGSLLPMDDLAYSYAEQPVYGFPNTNKLIYLKDAATSAYSEDIKAPSSAFGSTLYYDYDEIGNLIKDKNEYIATIEWTVDRKVKKITRDATALLSAGLTKSDLEYEYNAQRQRVTKIVKPRDPATKALKPSKDWLYTYYVYDAGGNVAAVYNRSSNPYVDAQNTPNLFKDAINLGEHHLYGSERLAINRPATPYEWAVYFVNCGGAMGECQNTPYGLTAPTALNTSLNKRFLGYKEFELNNHLGNVISTVSDRKIREWGNQAFNDDFSSNLNGWVNGTLSGGQLAVTTNVQYFAAEKSFATVAGKTYRLRFNVSFPAGAVIQAEVYPFPVTPPFLANITCVNGYNEFVFTANSAQSVIRIQKANAPGTTITYNIDNVIADEPSNYLADVLMHTDYYAFGQQMPGRTWQGVSDNYRYSFNGMEKDKESSSGSSNFGLRTFDTRIARFFSRDPFTTVLPNKSCYSFAGNSPISFTDKNGGFMVPPDFPGTYPKLNAILWKIDEMVNAKGAASNPILQALAKAANIDISKPEGLRQMREVLSYGNGPSLIIDKSMYGATGSTKGDGFIYISGHDIKDLENGTYTPIITIDEMYLPGIPKKSSTKSAAAAFNVFNTLLHEAGHHLNLNYGGGKPVDNLAQGISGDNMDILFEVELWKINIGGAKQVINGIFRGTPLFIQPIGQINATNVKNFFFPTNFLSIMSTKYISVDYLTPIQINQIPTSSSEPEISAEPEGEFDVPTGD